jgi:solute carrier family 13 (sodium-dependent dicarboxylate transporter), member 2/3/5
MAQFKITPWRAIGLVIALAAFGAMLALEGRLGRAPAAAAAVTALMALLWLTEALPIYWTACLPLLLYPVLMPHPGGAAENLRAAAAPYADPSIFLFAGGMGLAAAMEQCDLHRRIALVIMRAIGTDPRRILLGLLTATAAISLWISNTATAAMMLPIALAVVRQLEVQAQRRLAHYGAALMLAVAYGANIGGMGTKIGTVPNMVLVGFLRKLGVEVSFFEFVAIGLPFVILFIPLAWWALWRMGRKDALDTARHAATVEVELAALGRLRRVEAIVLIVFGATAAVWIIGKPLTDLLRTLAPGITTPQVEGGAAILAAVFLLALRSEGRQVLELRTLARVPWATLILLGGGFSMAAAVQGSGLGARMGDALAVVRSYPPLLQTVIASLVTVGLSAVASNVATTNVMLNVLNGAVSAEWRTTVLFSSALASSCDFALPAGTPPNAIVFGSGYLTVPKMAKTGAMLDIAAGLLVAVWCWLAVPWVL